MRHANLRHRLNRSTSWRRATLISLVKNLFKYQQIKTTHARAKAVRPLAEKLISLAKQNSLAAKRQAYRILGDHKLVSLLFGDIGPRFSQRNSGYIRILLAQNRRGDNAKLAVLELMEVKKIKKQKIKKEKETLAHEAKDTGKPQIPEKPAEAGAKETKTEVAVKEKPPLTKKPAKKFLGGLRNIFKKERGPL